MTGKLLFFALTLVVWGGCIRKEVKIDVKQMNETDKTEQWDINITRPAFSSTEEEIENSCVKFNDEVTGLINGIHAAFMEQAKEAIAGLDSAGMKQIAPYELFIQDSVMTADRNYISVLVTSYEMLGGAHGATNFYSVNYDVKKQQFLTKKEIINYDKATEINVLLKEYLKDTQNCFTFDAPTLENLTTLCFTPTTLEFVYAQYILGPYYCGPAMISIPREKLKDILLIK